MTTGRHDRTGSTQRRRIGTASRRISTTLLTILVVVFTLAPSGVAHDDRYAVDSTSGNDSGSPTLHAGRWSTNGCTAVADSTAGVFYFNHACDHHDGCYGGHWESRLGCDSRFYWNMESSCSYNFAWWNPSRALCRTVRNSYYFGVRALGAPAYHGWSISSLLG